MTERIVFFWDSENGFSRADEVSQALAIIDDEIVKLQGYSMGGNGFPPNANTKVGLAVLVQMKSYFLLLQPEVNRLRAEYGKIAALAEQEKIPRSFAEYAVKLEADMNQITQQLFSEVGIIVNALNVCRQQGIFGRHGTNIT